MINRLHSIVNIGKKSKEKLYKIWNWLKPRLRLTDIKDIATIIMAIVAIFALIGTYNSLNLNKSYYNDITKLSNDVKNLSEETQCLQKESRYSQISPPKIIIEYGYIETINPNDSFHGMKPSPYYDKRLVFRFNFIPTSKQFFYPDINETDRSWGGFDYSIGIDNNTYPLGVAENKNPFQELNFVWGYRNETLLADVIYDISISDREHYNFSARESDTQKRGNITVSFTFRIKDTNGNSYNDTISYIADGGETSTSMVIPKEFKFKIPEIYRC